MRSWVFDDFQVGLFFSTHLVGCPVDFDTDTLRLLLLTDAVEPVSASVSTVDSVFALGCVEIGAVVPDVSPSSGAYSSTARPLLSAYQAVNATSTEVRISVSQVLLGHDSDGPANIRYGMIYKDNAGDSFSPCLFGFDFETNYSVQAQEMRIDLSAGVIVYSYVPANS